jgi:heptosyltransferase-2
VKVLIAKLGATGDVVRTTPLIRRLGSEIVWLTERKNAVLLNLPGENVECFTWEQRDSIPDHAYDLVINLEDTVEVASFLKRFKAADWFGAYETDNSELAYTENAQAWFDLSLISAHGRRQADKLKLKNRKTYQELIFEGLGLKFESDSYLLPIPIETELSGDVAIAAHAGPVWPMKKWLYYDELKERLEGEGLSVNVLPKRASLLEHLADVRNHRCLVGGDTLPMHFALGTGTRCVSLFTCTSPWEIYEYGLQTKIISPLLEQFFYKRGYDERATSAIGVEEVFGAVMGQVEMGIKN